MKEFMFIKTKSGTYERVMFKDLNYIEGAGDYSKVHTDSTHYFTTLVSLKSFMKKLPSDFIRCHNSFIVNLNNVVKIDDVTIYFSNKKTIPISNKNIDVALDCLNYFKTRSDEQSEIKERNELLTSKKLIN